VTLAKGLAGGVPIGALIANDRASAGFAPGDHGSTFGGNPLACAAALAVLEIYEQQHLVERAALMGAYFRDRLESLMEKGAPITAIRGMGLMIGIALRDPVAVAVRANLLAKGYLVGAVGSQTIRLLPPLIIETEHIDQFMIDLEKTLQEVSA
jgi:acetylornithine/N-succinyldiaminopimelate aminotransferase